MQKLMAFALTTAFAAAAPAAQAVTFFATPSKAACASSCFQSDGRYQKVLSADAFRGPTRISALGLDRSILGDLQDQAFRVSFETAGGERVGDWGSFIIAGLNGDVVSLGGPAFDWDGADGDLVLTLTLVNLPKGGGGGFSGGRGIGGGFGGGFGGGSLSAPPFSPIASGPALASLAAPAPLAALAAAVPEPSAWALMLVGFGGAGAALRRSRSALAHR